MDRLQYDMTLSEDVGPEIQVVDESLVEIQDGLGSFNYGDTTLGSPISHTFTIYNWGNADLTLDGNSLTLPTGFSLVTGFAATVAPSQSTSFTVQFDANANGISTGTLSFSNNDADEGTYSFDLTGTVITPEPDMEIRSSRGQHLTNGPGEVDFGSTIAGSPLTVALNVTNHGDADLVLDLASMTLPTGFSVVGNPNTTVNPAGGFTFIEIQLDAVAIGSYSGTFSIGTNDPDDPTYSLTLTGEVTSQYTISISNTGLTNDTGDPADNSTYDPRFEGRVSGDFQGGSVQVQFDHNGDGVVDGYQSVANTNDWFYYDPHDHDSTFTDTIGAKTLNYRFVRLDSLASPVETGDWQTFSFNLEYDPSLGDVTIDQFGLAHDTGDGSTGWDTDKVTVLPQLTGMVNGPFGDGYVQVEFDHVGDGSITGFVQVDNSGGVFIYDPRDNDAGLVGFVGPVTISYRMVRYDVNNVAQETGNWTSFSFTMEALPAGDITIDDLALANDTTDGSAGGDTDLITYDPTLKGSGTIPVDLEFPTPIVQFDYNQDGIFDQQEYLDIDNDGAVEFEVLPDGITYGTINAAARIVYWDPNYSTYLTGSWATLTYTFEPMPAPVLTEFVLSNDTIGPDGDGTEEDATETDTSSDKVTKDPTIKGQFDPESGDVAFLKVEFDHDSDGIADHDGRANYDGSFLYLPEGLAAGVHTIKARSARYDELLGGDVYSDWTELTFTLERVAPYSIDEFQLVNDTPSDSGNSDTDGITRDRRLTGKIGSGSDVWGVTLEFDYDGDDVIDASTYTDYNGRFYFDPAGIGFGQKTIRARAVAYDAYSAEKVYSTWSSVTFTVDRPDFQPVYLTDIKLTDASASGNNESFNPVIEGRVMQPWIYPVGPSISSESAFSIPGYGEDSAAAYHSVQIDFDGDSIVDDTVETDWDGRFYYSPAQQTPGTYTIRIKSQSWNYDTETYGDSTWSDFTYNVLAKTDNVATIASFEILPGTGLTDSDHVAAIIGTITNDSGLEGVAVEFDEDGDGAMDSVVFTDEEGRFHYTTHPHAFGSVTIQARTVEWSHLHADYQSSAWTSISFMLAEDLVNDAPDIVNLELGNNEGTPETYDYTKSDPDITGRVVNDGYLHDVMVEIDLDGDGIANHVVKSGAYGYFSFTAEDLDYGSLNVKVRASEIDIATGSLLTGTWQTLAFTHEEVTTSVASITAFGITEDTLNNDGTGTTSDGITTNGEFSWRAPIFRTTGYESTGWLSFACSFRQHFAEGAQATEEKCCRAKSDGGM